MLHYSFNFQHHGRHSSYHHLLDFLAEDDSILDASLPGFCYSRWLNVRGIPIKAWRKFMETRAWRIVKHENHSWIHYLYPEHTYFSGDNSKLANTGVLFSCHLPSEVVNRGSTWLAPFLDGLKRADGVIVMSPDICDFYAERAPHASVRFIPHGIDVHYFKPPAEKMSRIEEKLNVLTVGNMLRDFRRLAEVIKRVHEVAGNRIAFKVIALKANLDLLRKHTGESAFELVHGVHGLSDQALLDCYHEADLMFLPLMGATANNALLEAMATGLPLLISDHPACRAYAGNCATYFEADEDADCLASRLLNLDPHSPDLIRRGLDGRKRAVEHLSWEQILNAHSKFIKDIGIGMRQ